MRFLNEASQAVDVEDCCPELHAGAFSDIKKKGGTLRDVAERIDDEGESPATHDDLSNLQEWLNRYPKSEEAGWYKSNKYFAFGGSDGVLVPYMYWNGYAYNIGYWNIGNTWKKECYALFN